MRGSRREHAAAGYECASHKDQHHREKVWGDGIGSSSVQTWIQAVCPPGLGGLKLEAQEMHLS